jgi:hypothetical protein
MRKFYLCLILSVYFSVPMLPGSILSIEDPLPFSVDDTYLTIWNGEQYVPVFLKGMNLGISVPGTFPGELNASRADYGRWLQQIRDAGFNVLRVYTLHYPWFYEVLDSFNTANPQSPLFLLQGIWLEEEHPGFTGNLFELNSTFIDEIETNVDCIHGNRSVPARFGKAFGNYETDVSRWVMGYIIGREVSHSEVLLTDEYNAGITSYKGRFFSLNNSKATEAWFTGKLDHLVSHEQDHYKTQRPVSISSWPTLDPLHHPTEFHRDEDTAYIDLSSVDFSAAAAGMFISYHAYPYYPDFISRSPEFSGYHDSWGPNPYIGYLKALKSHYSRMPLIIAEFGNPSSLGIAHYASNGIHHGGSDYQKQAKDNLRMLDNISTSGSGGGIQFAWIDEWFKRTWLVDPLDYIPDRRILWHNLVSAEQNFGLVGFRKKERSFRPWTDFCDDCDIRSVEAFADYTYFNIRINTGDFLGIMDTIWVALDTYDAALGESVLPTGHVMENRPEFLIMITNHSCQLFVTQAYDQFGKWHRLASPGQLFRSVPTDGDPWNIVRFKNNYFEQEIQFIGNLNFRRLDNPASSNDLVILDATKIDISLPWTLINFSDPSEMTVIHDYRNVPGYQDTLSDGISLSIIHRNTVYTTASRFTWDHWQTAGDTEEFLKDSYYITKDKLWQLPGNPVAVTDVYKVPSNGVLQVLPESGVLSNDLSLDGTTMTAWLEEPVTTGNLRLNPDGGFEYRAGRGITGEFYFRYRTIAGGKISAPATVKLIVDDNLPGKGFLAIHPNPTTGYIRAESTSTIEVLEVFSHSGQQLVKKRVMAKYTDIDLSPYPPGVYTVRIFSGGQWVARKVVLMR